LATKAGESIVYADEAGMDNRDDYAYGWNLEGQRFYAFKSGQRQGRVNMIAALCNHQLMAPFTVEGACNRAVFEKWLETCLLPVLKPGQVVVIDNATFHLRTLQLFEKLEVLSQAFGKGGRIEQLIHDTGCEILYLPPYSPDLNKIEKSWSWLKSRIRKKLRQFDSLRDAMEDVLRSAS